MGSIRFKGAYLFSFFALCVPALPPGHWGAPSVVAYKSKLREVQSTYVN